MANESLKIQIDEEKDDEVPKTTEEAPENFFNVRTPNNLNKASIHDGFRRLSMVKDAEFNIQEACRSDSFNAYSNPSLKEYGQIREEDIENDEGDLFADLPRNETNDDEDPIMALLQNNP